MKAKLTLENGTELNVTVDESELKKETSKRWKPEKYEEYWTVAGSGSVISSLWEEVDVDLWRYSQRNLFKTEEEAAQHLAYLKARAAILDHADEVNEGWKPNWNSTRQDKYTMAYSHFTKILNACQCINNQSTAIAYYKSREAARDAIDKVGDEYLTVLGVEK